MLDTIEYCSLFSVITILLQFPWYTKLNAIIREAHRFSTLKSCIKITTMPVTAKL